MFDDPLKNMCNRSGTGYGPIWESNFFAFQRCNSELLESLALGVPCDAQSPCIVVPLISMSSCAHATACNGGQLAGHNLLRPEQQPRADSQQHPQDWLERQPREHLEQQQLLGQPHHLPGLEVQQPEEAQQRPRPLLRHHQLEPRQVEGLPRAVLFEASPWKHTPLPPEAALSWSLDRERD